MSSVNFAVPDFCHRPVGSPTATLSLQLTIQEPFTRDRIIEALQAMPPNATIDDAIERLVFLAKVEIGLAELEGFQGIPHDQAKHRWAVMRILWSPQSLRDLQGCRQSRLYPVLGSENRGGHCAPGLSQRKSFRRH